jgi:sulfonate transport system permease protein
MNTGRTNRHRNHESHRQSFARQSPKLPRVDGLIPWIVPLAIILIWQLACVTGFVSARVLPAPSDVALAGWKLLLSGELARNIWVSFWRASVGFLIGGSIGFSFGLANGLSQLPASSRTRRCRWCATSRIWR